MNQTFQFSRLTLPAPKPTAAPIELLRREVESTFVEAGRNLEVSVDVLHGLRGQFTLLEQSLGAERSAELGRLIDDVNGQITHLRSDFDQFGTATDALRDAVRAIRTEVAELDRVVRTIANVSINARIQGNSLVPPRAQVAAFIERLGAMSDEAETILHEVNDAMSGAMSDISAMEYEHQDMLQELRRNVMPAISGFAGTSRRMRDGQKDLQIASQDLADQMGQIFSDVSRLIVALQIGDSTRQRLERVQDTIERCAEASPTQESLLIELAIGLINGARGDALSEVGAAVVALEDVNERALRTVRAASQSAFGRRALRNTSNGEAEQAALNSSLEASRQHFAAMQVQSNNVHDRLDIILRHEATLRRIAHEVRLAGINAVIICAKLGEEGRALRELAQWLRMLTDESDAIVQRLQDILAHSREIIRTVGEERIGGMDRSLSGFMVNAGTLGAIMRDISAAIEATSASFSGTAQVLPERVGAALRLLGGFRGRMTALDGYVAELEARRLQLPPPALPPQPGSEEELAIGDLRERYTMAQERMIHDALLLQVMTAAAQAPAAQDDLDDILF